jgi:LysR family transcriptional regulator, nod-box dependent transcriptional activator
METEPRSNIAAAVVENHLAQMGYERKIVTSTESLATAPFLVHGTPVVALVPKRLAERLRQAADTRFIEPPFELPPLLEKLVWSPRFTHGATHVWMRTELAELAKLL